MDRSFASPFRTSYSAKFLNLLLLFFALLSLVVLVHPAPTGPGVVEPITNILEETPPRHPDDQDDALHRRQGRAGLAWGPVNIGNLKLYLTNPHTGYAGAKFPSAEHVNFHVDKADGGPRGTYSSVVNMHIVKYGNPLDDSSCLYAWDSVTKTTVFDQCSDAFEQIIAQGVQAIEGFVDTLLTNANFVASIVIGIALVTALTALLASLPVVAVA
ncbi:MAG: hypothetical protein L6R39_001292 [Caloplaca ligustica]|nr:MAG: hypothetical protein L6R39_001292 [Caloplaca ligustica]